VDATVDKVGRGDDVVDRDCDVVPVEVADGV
jgi:hypothetical protein